MKRDKLVAMVFALCVFVFHSLRSQSLSEPSANLRTIPQVCDPSQAARTIPQVYGRSQRFTNVRTSSAPGRMLEGNYSRAGRHRTDCRRPVPTRKLA